MLASGLWATFPIATIFLHAQYEIVLGWVWLKSHRASTLSCWILPLNSI